MDSTSVVVAINLDPDPRKSLIALDETFFPIGSKVVNLLPQDRTDVQKPAESQTPYLELNLGPRDLAIFKRA